MCGLISPLQQLAIYRYNEGNILTFETFKNKYQIKTNFLHYASLVNAIRKLWESVEKWIFEKTGIITTLKKYETMFGILEVEQKYVLNWLIFNIKYYIYKDILRNKFQVEKYIYFKNCQFDKFNKCWDKWIYLFS